MTDPNRDVRACIRMQVQPASTGSKLLVESAGGSLPLADEVSGGQFRVRRQAGLVSCYLLRSNSPGAGGRGVQRNGTSPTRVVPAVADRVSSQCDRFQIGQEQATTAGHGNDGFKMSHSGVFSRRLRSRLNRLVVDAGLDAWALSSRRGKGGKGWTGGLELQAAWHANPQRDCIDHG